MLAYVFWHWPLATISEQDYIDRLIAFHQSLHKHAFPGFHSSHAFQIGNTPWGPPDQSLYEDWYFVENFATLETLNQMAVAPINKTPHDHAAQYAAGGTAGVYQLCAGEANPSHARIACWFGKPTGMRYEAFLSLVRPLVTENGGALWQRQMTLGPAPEFCWWAPVAPALPDEMMGMSIPLELIS